MPPPVGTMVAMEFAPPVIAVEATTELPMIAITIGPVPAWAIRTIGAIGPVRPVGAIRAIGSVRPVRAIRAIRSVRAIRTVRPIRPVGAVPVRTIRAIGSIRAIGPIRTIGSVGPIRPIWTVGSIGTVGSIRTIGPVRAVGAIRSRGPIRPVGAVRSIEPCGAVGTIRSGGSVRPVRGPRRPGFSGRALRALAALWGLERARFAVAGLPSRSFARAFLRQGLDRRRERAGQGGDGGEGHQKAFHWLIPRMPLLAACDPTSTPVHEPRLNVVRAPKRKKPRDRGGASGRRERGVNRRSTGRWRSGRSPRRPAGCRCRRGHSDSRAAPDAGRRNTGR